MTEPTVTLGRMPYDLSPPGWRAWFAEADPDVPDGPIEVTWEPVLAWGADGYGVPFALVLDRLDPGAIAADDDQLFVATTGPGQVLTRTLLTNAVGRWRERNGLPDSVDPLPALLRAGGNTGPAR